MSTIKITANDSPFLNTLRQRVNDYFKDNHIKQTGNYKLYTKSVLLLSAFFFTYFTLVFFTPSAVIAISLCVVLGFLMAAIGFNVMHDSAHGSYSSNKYVNEFMTLSLNLLGGSSFIWKQKHNINHHSYTNIEGMDDDIDIKPFIRVNTAQKKYWFHRFQHIYGFLLYGLTYLFWVFFNDFKKYFSGKLSDYTPLKKMKVTEHVMFWFTKIFYTFSFVVLPVYQLGWMDFFIGYSIVVFVCGLVIAIVFQLAHIYDNAEFILPKNEELTIHTEWAVHQINTTSNFATGNKMIGWFWGGLNFQVEHHLFPKVSHIHYPKISTIVKATCEEFKLDYKEFPTVSSAVLSHIIHLKKLGIAA